jgi:hypothetical protein
LAAGRCKHDKTLFPPVKQCGVGTALKKERKTKRKIKSRKRIKSKRKRKIRIQSIQACGGNGASSEGLTPSYSYS